MTAILGVTARRATPDRITCATLNFPAAVRVSHQDFSERHRRNQDWV